MSTPPQINHETTDASPRDIVLFAIGLALLAAVVVGLSYLLFTRLAHRDDNASPATNIQALRGPPPSPPLQPSRWHEGLPYQDMNALNREYARLSTTFGDEQMPDLRVHQRIPVEAAINILAQEGLPHDTAKNIPVPQGTQPSMDTPYSNAGRSGSTGTAAAPGTPTTEGAPPHAQ